MRIEALEAHAFGPFRRRRFEFAPGLNLVHGPNEAGKSSLHAALCTGLCGVKRGPGKAREEQEFEQRFRPWDEAAWKVSLFLRLEDGRRIEMVQDLADKPKSRALDADLLRDYTQEILTDGTPDASRWLGLERRAFLASACVRQAEIVPDENGRKRDVDALQHYLQRAATQFGGDATAAEAIRRLEAFRSENVGLDRANVTRPLRRAREEVDAARAALDTARQAHAAYLDDLRREAELLADAARRDRAVRCAMAAERQDHALERGETLMKVRELSARHPTGSAPTLQEDDELAQAAQAALERWKLLPAVPALVGPDAQELVARRDALEAEAPAPVRAIFAACADVQPAPDVRAAQEALASIREALQLHTRFPKTDPGPAPWRGATIEVLTSLAQALEVPEPTVDPELATRRSRLEAALDARRQNARSAARAWGAGAAVAGLVAVVALLVAGGTVRLVVAGVAVLAAAVSAAVAFRRAGETHDHETSGALRQLDNEMAVARDRHAEWQRKRLEAAQRAVSIELAPDAAAVREAIRKREDWERRQRDWTAWDQDQQNFESEVEKRSDVLRCALDARGVPAAGDVLADAVAYQAACDLRQNLVHLEKEIAGRRLDEAEHAAARAEHTRAVETVLDAARRCGLQAATPESAVPLLQRWSQERRERRAAHDVAREEVAALRSLLNGRTLAELAAEAATAAAEAAAVARGFDAAELAAAPRDPAVRRALEDALTDARTQQAQLRGKIDAANLPSVAEAEEALRGAEEELARVRGLDAVLETTLVHLRQAEDRVHRDVAPRLAAEVRAWLPRVTAGRYDEVKIDPQTLLVAVRGPGLAWRPAAQLSYGTAEQVHLLLRVALVRLLTKPGETSPLFLDDVTVQFDRDRKRAVLETLWILAEAQQIVLFSQEDDVIAWARERLAPPFHRVVELGLPMEPTGAPTAAPAPEP